MAGLLWVPDGRPQAIRLWNDAQTDRHCMAMRFASEAELAAADLGLPDRLRRAVPRRRAEWLAGRRCAGEALRLLTGKTVYPGMGEDRAPIWPAGVVGSISHSGDVAVAIALRKGACRGVGIDVERVLDAQETPGIALQAMTALERRRLEGGLDPFLVTLAFSAKESLFKALHPMLRRPLSFDSSELVAWREDGTAILRLREELSPTFPAGREIDVRFGRLHGLLLTCVQLPG